MVLSSNAAAEGTSVPNESEAHKGKQSNTFKNILYPYNCTIFHFQYPIQWIARDIQHFIIKQVLRYMILLNHRLM